MTSFGHFSLNHFRKKVLSFSITDDFFVFIIGLIIGGLLMFHTFGYQDGQLVIASKVWSDFAAHIPLIRSFSYGQNLPVEYPLFPNEPIRYHYLFYLLVAMFEKAGLNIALALNSMSALGFSLLLLMIYKITKLFFNSKKAGLLAIYLFLFNGSLSFIEYFNTNGWTFNSLKNVLVQTSYSSFGPWDGGTISAFWNLNIYTNQRHFSMGIALFLIGIYPIISSISVKNYVLNIKTKILLIIAFVSLPVLHQAGFFALIAFVFSFLMLKAVGKYFFPSKKIINIKNNLVVVYVLCLFTSVISSIFFGVYSESKIIFELGYLSQQKDLFGMLIFWFKNIGFYLPLIFVFPMLIFYLDKKTQRINLLLFYFVIISFFMIGNLFKFSTDMINNHKLFNIFLIGMSIITSGFLIDLWKKKNLGKIIVLFGIFLLSFSGIIDLFPLINDDKYHLNDVQNNQTSSWIKSNTPPSSVFLTSTYLYHPASIAGRKIFLDYGYFAWSMGYDDSSRRSLLPSLFSSNITKNSWCNLMVSNQIDYVIISPGEGELGRHISLQNSFVVKNIKPVFVSDDDYIIYDVRKYCNEKTKN